MTLGIVATLKVKPGKEAEFEAVFLELQAHVKKSEPGALQYELFKSKTPSTYIVMEQYKTEADLAAHRTTPHMAAAGPKLGAVLDGRPGIEMLEKL
ncbi:MAG: antibiotic biosynthesis monooxygenase [Alphaproteobacteria bacterium]|nr:antibiotic biosynthesis monooxygenase [Alphaproteobacteria bacterium]